MECAVRDLLQVAPSHGREIRRADIRGVLYRLLHALVAGAARRAAARLSLDFLIITFALIYFFFRAAHDADRAERGGASSAV